MNFFLHEIEFSGNVFSESVVSVSPDKVKTILELSKPMDKK